MSQYYHFSVQDLPNSKTLSLIILPLSLLKRVYHYIVYASLKIEKLRKKKGREEPFRKTQKWATKRNYLS